MATMSKGQPGTETLQAAIRKLWLEGAPIAWKVPEAGSQQEEGEPPSVVSSPLTLPVLPSVPNMLTVSVRVAAS